MADPRMNSLHLEPVRRQDFRRAREDLLNACGQQTLCAQVQPAEPASFSSHTFIQNQDEKAVAPTEHWLADREYIYPLKLGINTVGRSSDNDVVVADAFVSRRQCAILVHHNHTCELHDTASKNGTFLNGAKLEGPTRLKPGDEIRICDRVLVFRSRSEGADGQPTHTLAE
jgi:hypothetical protein